MDAKFLPPSLQEGAGASRRGALAPARARYAGRSVASEVLEGAGRLRRGVPGGAPGLEALKVSLLPWDARFAREAEVLSRLSHPSIPRLLDHGEVRPASGADYPFIVMEWVEGPPLYAWAEQAVDAVLSAPGAVGAAQGRGTALGRPHRLPARGGKPCSAEGHGGRACAVGRPGPCRSSSSALPGSSSLEMAVRTATGRTVVLEPLEAEQVEAVSHLLVESLRHSGVTHARE